MLDREAHLTVEVTQADEAAARVRAMVEALGGEVVSEVFEDQAMQAGAALTIRVPSEQTDRLLGQLKSLGVVRSFRSQVVEVSRKVADAEAVIKNMEAALARYRALLDQAENVTELANLENEILRLETALERVRTDLAWTVDRVRRSTIYLKLTLPREEPIEEVAKLFPGLRGTYVLDLEPDDGKTGYWGGGLSILVRRAFNVDLDLMRGAQSERNVDLLLATAGVELYSNLLGAGRRRHFNPYLGFRAGYANLASDSAAVLGGSLGLELVKTERWFVDLQARAYALIAADSGTHVLLQPALAFHFAY